MLGYWRLMLRQRLAGGESLRGEVAS
jgi:hypothetical protein